MGQVTICLKCSKPRQPSSYDATSETPDFQNEAEQILVSEFAPPGVLVNSNMDITLFRGETAPFIKVPSGQASFNLFKMAKPELVPDLRMAIQAAKKRNVLINKEDLSFHEGDRHQFLTLSVIPLPLEPRQRERYYWVLFVPAVEPLQTISPEPGDTRRKGKRPTWRTIVLKDKQIKELDRELVEAKAYQQSVAEDHEATQEEITSANEELQSTNEELQSTNEELETAKEELQSTNEELTTVNDELQNRNADLIRLNNDLVNLLGTVEFPIVMVGADSRIRRFTPAAGKLLNLLPTDVGRPIGDIRPGFDDPNLQSLVSEVIETITVKEREVCTREGRSYRLQARPYKTTDNRIDGAVISLIDITVLKEHLTESQTALKYATAVADTLPHPLLVLDEQMHLLAANPGFAGMFNIPTSEIIGADIMSVLDGKSRNIARLSQLLTEVTTGDRPLKDFEIEHDFPGTGRRLLLLNCQKIRWQDPTMPKATLLLIDDITERRTLERTIEQSLGEEKKARSEAERAKAEAERAKAEAERANEAKDVFLATLSHELRTPLTAILSWSQLLKRPPMDPEKLKHGLNTIEQSAHTQGQLINDLLDISRIQSGKLALTLTAIEPVDVVRAAIMSIRPMAEQKNIAIEIIDGAKIGMIRGDAARLQQIFWNLLTNSIKFSPEGSKIEVHIGKLQEHGHSYASFRVVDQGKGIDPAFLPNIFTRFSQQDSTSTRVYGGLGIGLALVHDLVKTHSGSVKADSPGLGKGATFTVLLPLAREGESREVTPASGNKQAPRPTPPDLSGVKVLIVDDDPGSLDAFAEIVKAFGGIPTLSSSVREAMVSFEKVRPDIVVSDIAMPLEDGYALIARIRSLPPDKGGKAPALALTAYAAQHDIARVVTAGFQEHMAKPVDSEEFGRAIERLAKTTETRLAGP